jgi:DNA-binding transcriptional MocR family regulator
MDKFDPEAEITITCGGTEALYDAIQAVIGAGDEAIVFDPPTTPTSLPCGSPAAAACIPLQPPAFAV